MHSEPILPIERLLAIRMDNLGDIVMLTPALRALRKAYPQANITLMVSPAGSQMASLLPWIDDVIVWRAAWQELARDRACDPAQELRLIQLIQDRNFDAALIFTSFTQSPYPPAYVCYLAGIPVCAGLSHEFGGRILSHWGKPPAEDGHQVDRNLALLKQLGIPDDGRHMELHVPAAVQADVDDLCVKNGIPIGMPWMVVAPGASCSARRYPLERFSGVIAGLAGEIDAPLLILGSEREKSGLSDLQHLSQSGKIISLIGKTSVPEMVEIIRRADLVIANNSAALHIADAFETPQVILYSGTEYRSQWMPRFSPAILLNREMECSPCYRFECPFDLNCLDVQPEAVIQAAVNLFNNHRRKPEIAPAFSGDRPHLLVDKNGSKFHRKRIHRFKNKT